MTKKFIESTPTDNFKLDTPNGVDVFRRDDFPNEIQTQIDYYNQLKQDLLELEYERTTKLLALQAQHGVLRRRMDEYVNPPSENPDDLDDSEDEGEQ